MPWPAGAQPIVPQTGADATDAGTAAEQPSVLSTIGTGAKNLGVGALKGAGSTAHAIGSMLYPDALAKHLTGVEPPDEAEKTFAPHGTMQSIGKGVEQAGEFMLPGGAEEQLAEKAPALMRPAAKIGLSALSAGGVNKLQGGSFGAGAAAGGVGAAVGAGLKAAAPKLAEAGLRIGAGQRAFGKTPGQAALDLTTGVRPESVLASGRQSMGNLMGDLEGHVDAASVRPAPHIAGFLPPPREEMPLHNFGGDEGRLSEPVRLTQADRSGNPQLQAPSLSTPMAPGHQVEFPERLASGDTGIRRTEFGSHPGMGQAQYIGEIPGERGGPGEHGVLYRRPEMSASIPPTSEANPSASLRPARGIISTAQGKAAQQEAGGLHTQLGEMGDFLHTGRVSGEPIPENVTPRRLLDLKRGFSDEHLRWNPNVHDEAMRAGRGAYGAMDQELDRLVPSAAPTNQKISSLIEVLHNAERETRMPSAGQRALARFIPHTGAATLGGLGAVGGYKEGGVPGAIAGGAAGILGPELIASPEGQLAAARTFNRFRNLRPAVGSALQLTRKRDEEEQ